MTIHRRCALAASISPSSTARNRTATSSGPSGCTSNRCAEPSRHKAVIASSTGSPVRTATRRRTPAAAARWCNRAADNGSTRCASSIATINGCSAARCSSALRTTRKRSIGSAGAAVSDGNNAATAPSGRPCADRVATSISVTATSARSCRTCCTKRVLPVPAGATTTTPRPSSSSTRRHRASSASRPISGHLFTHHVRRESTRPAPALTRAEQRPVFGLARASSRRSETPRVVTTRFLSGVVPCPPSRGQGPTAMAAPRPARRAVRPARCVAGPRPRDRAPAGTSGRGWAGHRRDPPANSTSPPGGIARVVTTRFGETHQQYAASGGGPSFSGRHVACFGSKWSVPPGRLVPTPTSRQPESAATINSFPVARVRDSRDPNRSRRS